VRLTIGWGLLSDKQIAAALASKDEWERHSALQNLNQTKFESCWPALVQMCSDPSKNIRCYLPEVLAAYPHREEAIPVLLIMSEDFDAGVKIAAAKALHTLGRKDGIPVLIQMLRNQADPASGQAGAAHRTLKDITGKELKNDEWEDWWAKNQKGNEK
jgi:HEAT repeat protein